MLNPILSFSATRRMRSFRTLLVVIAYVAVLLGIVLAMMFQLIGGGLLPWFWLIWSQRHGAVAEKIAPRGRSDSTRYTCRAVRGTALLARTM